MSKVFDGVDALIDVALGVQFVGSSPPHYRCKKAALLLSARPDSLDIPKLIDQMRGRIQDNLADPEARWRTMGSSRENWRWKKNLTFAPRLRADEKTVEKLVAANCGECWVNQVPTASGLLDPTSETHCNIDLVCRVGENSYEFIELKYDDSTPLFAAFEILKYALLLLISRERHDDFKYSPDWNPLVWASAVKLIVLAPPGYYDPYSLQWLEKEFNSALALFSTRELALQFAFERMPWPHDQDCRAALGLRERVYAN
jgi:hypothetical protein